MNARLLVSTAVLATLVACGTETTTPSVEDRPRETPALPLPLPLTDHVVTQLPGFTTSERPVLQGVAAFAEVHDKKPAELAATGFVGGVTIRFQPESGMPGNALSIAEEFATVEQAETEAERLHAANAEPDRGATAAPLDLPGIPGVRATQISGTFKGQPFASVEIVFVEGTVVHELFAIGAGTTVSVPDIADTVTALYDAVAGRPLA